MRPIHSSADLRPSASPLHFTVMRSVFVKVWSEVWLYQSPPLHPPPPAQPLTSPPPTPIHLHLLTCCRQSDSQPAWRAEQSGQCSVGWKKVEAVGLSQTLWNWKKREIEERKVVNIHVLSGYINCYTIKRMFCLRAVFEKLMVAFKPRYLSQYIYSVFTLWHLICCLAILECSSYGTIVLTTLELHAFSWNVNVRKICQRSALRFRYILLTGKWLKGTTVLSKQNNSQLHGTLYCVCRMPKCNRCFDVCGFPLIENICLSYLARIGYSLRIQS